MCRLFGQRADPEYDTCEPLCSSHNALQMQSHQHPHGWGIGWYVDGIPHVQRGIMPAHADAAFARTARRARSDIVVAHVRDASVGPVRLENTHPFAFGRWLFAHNGTLARFRASARVRRAIEAEIDPGLRPTVRGDTDSERCFYLFLTRLSARRSSAEDPTLADVRAALAETVAVISRITDGHPPRRSTLNFLVSNGRLLAACRHGKTLHTARHAGEGHVFAVASEPIGRADWAAVPEDGFVGVDAEHHFLTSPLQAPRRNFRTAGRSPRPRT
jgi:predicted glutamine amidotransferase